ncbi:MAG TPA: MBL fold metallo-hydrolase [Spirochaetota bacterium]|nr:MBL fold metallo-hydrolase [Spirochaetota bacterium]HPN82162.1 MBL fold metallo-hydrolase [Spirochaetota bacterium]
MYVKFWGVRGSIPTPGPKTVRYGGNTSCIEIRLESGQLLIIDAGSGIRELGNWLLANDQKKGPLKTDIFLTHTHWDHIHGYPFFTPTYIKGNEFRIHGPVNYSGKLEKIFSAQMDYTYYPVKLEDAGAKVSFNELKEGTIYVGGAKVTTCYLNHPILCLGYRIEADDRVVCTVYDHEPYVNIFSTDGRLDTDEAREAQEAVDMANAKIRKHIENADLVIYDSQYHSREELDSHRGWGHSSIEEALSDAVAARVKRLAIFHHDPTRSDDSLDAFHLALRERVKQEGLGIITFPAKEGLTVPLSGAPPRG